jgi:hypothetical protein
LRQDILPECGATPDAATDGIEAGGAPDRIAFA